MMVSSSFKTTNALSKGNGGGGGGAALRHNANREKAAKSTFNEQVI
ncbi:553_t:CDS:2 [Acaulospora colombiana]|uniref:553_t:CDS:1 n=1 Tax=Acaulospora colombiana TaxID=27376 RepID=A0ACA9KB54_9GLOM|nr:553_t:CDS:2 [Acaulospora colombiana]